MPWYVYIDDGRGPKHDEKQSSQNELRGYPKLLPHPLRPISTHPNPPTSRMCGIILPYREVSEAVFHIMEDLIEADVTGEAEEDQDTRLSAYTETSSEIPTRR